MPKVIYKYELPFREFDKSFRIIMPLFSKILSFQEQHNKFVIWAEVDPEMDTHEKLFKIHATGSMVDPSYSHVGTLQKGELVFHLYEGL